MAYFIKWPFKSLVILLMVPALTTLPLAALATDTKAKECQMLSDAIVRANYRVSDLNNPAQELNFFNALSENLQALSLTDLRLQTLKDVLKHELKSRVLLWQEVISVLDSKDLQQIEILKVRIDLERAKGRALAEAFNEYCFGG